MPRFEQTNNFFEKKLEKKIAFSADFEGVEVEAAPTPGEP